MKANIPEKIYLQKYDVNTLICLNKWNVSEEWSNKPCNEKIATNIEYIRIDAFIEKADKFISTFFHPDDTELRNCLLKKFHEYMKGE